MHSGTRINEANVKERLDEFFFKSARLSAHNDPSSTSVCPRTENAPPNSSMRTIVTQGRLYPNDSNTP